MFARGKLSSLLCQNSKRFSSSSTTSIKKEVFVSQSRDMLSNVALEDWAVQNTNLYEKTVLILSNNVCTNSNIDIKATLISANTLWKVEDFDSLVLSSLPPDLPLKSIPNLEVNHECLDGGSQSYSLKLSLSQEVKTRSVLQALQTIGDRFLNDENMGDKRNQELDHIQLVRPDDGWFPGLQKIKAEIEENMKMVEKIKTSKLRLNKEKKKSGKDYSPLQNSFGQ